ncbi:MAG TPA: SGNH hydrolase domain-containing protein [Mycobacteriales bacterium]|nr:SGNH hydrolase domain-containing protein [Mycobacteriales bacterium]
MPPARRAPTREWLPRAAALLAAGSVLLGCTSTTTPARPTTAPTPTFAPTLRSAPASPTAVAPASRRRGPLRVVVLGDSVAETLAAGFPDIAGRHGVTVFDAAIIGCGVTTLSPYRYFGALHERPRRCGGWRHAWATAVRRHRPDVVLVLVGRWEVMDQRLRGRWTRIGERGYDAYLTRQLRSGYAAAASTGAPVVFATAPYYHRGDRPDGGSWPEDDPRRVDAFNHLLRSALSAEPRVSFVDLNRRTSGGRHTYTNVVHGIRLRYDGVHFTLEAGRWIAPWIYPQLAAAAAR